MDLVITGGYFLLKPYEQTLLRLEDLMDTSGEFYSIWTLPSHVAYNGEAREIRTCCSFTSETYGLDDR